MYGSAAAAAGTGNCGSLHHSEARQAWCTWNAAKLCATGMSSIVSMWADRDAIEATAAATSSADNGRIPLCSCGRCGMSLPKCGARPRVMSLSSSLGHRSLTIARCVRALVGAPVGLFLQIDSFDIARAPACNGGVVEIIQNYLFALRLRR